MNYCSSTVGKGPTAKDQNRFGLGLECIVPVQSWVPHEVLQATEEQFPLMTQRHVRCTSFNHTH